MHTVPQPPSAFMPRNAAWVPGRSEPALLQWGVCQNLFFVVFGPTVTGSKRMSCSGFRGIA